MSARQVGFLVWCRLKRDTFTLSLTYWRRLFVDNGARPCKVSLGIQLSNEYSNMFLS